MQAAGNGGRVPNAGGHLQRLLVVPFRLGVVALDLRDLADLLCPGRAQRRTSGEPGERLPDECSLVIKLAPGVQLRAHDLGEGSGLVVVACLVQMVAALEQVVQVRVPVLRPGGSPPLPVLGGALVSPGDLAAAPHGSQVPVQRACGPPVDEDLRGVRARRDLTARDLRQHQQARVLAFGDQLGEVGRGVVRRGRALYGWPGRGRWAGLSDLEEQRIAPGGLAVDGYADQQSQRGTGEAARRAVQRAPARPVCVPGVPCGARRHAGHATSTRNEAALISAAIALASTLLLRGNPGSSGTRDI